MKEWFEGRRYVQPIGYSPWWLEVLFGIGSALIVVLLIAMFVGCATVARDTEVCYMKPIGVTEEGYTVAAVQCMTPEAFQESQK